MKECMAGLILGAICTLFIILIYNSFISYYKSKGATGIGGTPISSTSVPLVDETNLLRRTFPEVIIIGVRKGGTRALIDMLDSHPQIKSGRKGEIHFFDRSENYRRGVEWYIGCMPFTKEGELTIEKSPSYFITPEVPERISSISKTVKLILIVRDPVIRAVSDYTQLDMKKSRYARERPTFEEFVFNSNGEVKITVSPIKVSMYDTHYQRWLNWFSREQILIINGDKLIQNPIHELVKVEKFLQIQSYFTPDILYYNKTKGFYCWKPERSSSVKYKCLGSAKGLIHPQISEQTISKLRDFFKPHMKIFCNLAHINTTWCTL